MAIVFGGISVEVFNGIYIYLLVGLLYFLSKVLATCTS
jgi:hypothetical protein